MKNIHIIPTNKPSRLYEFGGQFTLTQEPTNAFRNYYIYITNDEEIKEGDWFIANNKLGKCTNGLWAKKGASILTKKIILTTDLDLIADGVQAITNTFAEWFVKNPSCESVKIESWQTKGEWDLDYKIIIPQEEPKQIKCYCGHTITCDCGPLEEPKQETLEEFIKSQPYYGYCTTEYKEGIEVGAKWQTQRIPSIIEEYLETAFISKEQGYMNPQKWFEQQKKK